MTKTLTQDAFKGAPDWVKSAAVNESGIAYGLEKTKSNLRVLFIGSGGVHIASGSNTIELGKGYDTTNWQQSAIDRKSTSSVPRYCKHGQTGRITQG